MIELRKKWEILTMTFNELCFSKQNFFKDISVKASKEILKGNTPIYRSKSMFEDEILLTEHFDETLHIALSTDSMARMSKAESVEKYNQKVYQILEKIKFDAENLDYIGCDEVCLEPDPNKYNG